MNKLLDKLDKFLETQKESEQKLFFFLPVLLFGFLSYYFLYPMTNQNLENSINENKSLQSKISNLKTTNNGLKNQNLKLSTILKKADKILIDLRKDKNEMDSLINQLDFLKFDLNKWAEFYNNIPNLAQKYNLLIKNLENEMNIENSENLINKKMTLTIDVYGNFINLIKFMNEFESKKELVKIKSIKIDNRHMIVVIEIYGAKL